MAKKASDKIGNYEITPAHKALQRFTMKDLKRACIVRGMDFEELVKGDIWKWQGFFLQNYHEKENMARLDEFDVWFGAEMALNGKGTDNPEYAWMYHPDLRMGFHEGQDDQGELIGERKNKLFKKPKEPKPKREKAQEFGGIIRGTKKEYTYQKTDDIVGMRLDQGKEVKLGLIFEGILKRVMEKYPDANPKSVKIWVGRAIPIATKKYKES